MGRSYEGIDERLAAFLIHQPVFFVGTAPLAGDGHVNVSPKGVRGTFAVLAPLMVAYLDLTGSGAETIAHVRENGRIVLMFCAFEGRPRIVRLHGRGTVVESGGERFEPLRERFAEAEGARAVILVELTRVSDSCGYGVPNMTLASEREELAAWAGRKGPEGLAAYQSDKNAVSLDGLPALEPGVRRPG